MAGHSHWAGIKHKKKKEDKKRGKIFSKLSKKIMSAARRGGGDPEHNLELEYAIERAKDADMPKDNIERAILKGTGELDGGQMEPVRYEGYSSGGAAVMVDTLTDNRNRTASEVKKIFSEHGGNVGTSGCVSWLFKTKGLILLRLNGMSEEEVFDLAVESGAEDFQEAGDLYELTCTAEDLHDVQNALKGQGVEFESAEITQIPQNYVDLDVNDGRKTLKLMDELEDHDDVENVASNFNLPDELVEELRDEE